MTARRRGVRLTALVAVLGIVGTACSGVPNVVSAQGGGTALSSGAGSDVAGGSADGGDGLSPGGEPAGAPGGAASGPASGSSATASAGSSGIVASGTATTGGSTGGATSRGSQGSPHSASTGADFAPGTRGVTDKDITIAFHMPLTKANSGCSNGNACVQAYQDRAKFYVKWFNQHINYPGGRKLQYTIVDDCGTTTDCYDPARAAALKITKEIRPFASLGNSVNQGADEPIVADATTRAGIIEIGTNFQTLSDLNSRAPYAWSPYSPAELGMEDLGWGIAKRFDKAPYVDDNGATHKRVWATVMFDDKPDHFMADSVTHELAGLGVSVGHQYYVSADTGTAAQQAPSLAARMQADGVNSVIFSVTGQPGIAVTTAFDQSQYHPDWYVGAYGGYLVALWDPLFGKAFTDRLYAAGPPCVVCERFDENVDGSGCASCNMVDNGDAYVKAYHEAGGQAQSLQKDCGCAFDIWTQLSLLTIGIIDAPGPTITDQAFAQGIYSLHDQRCNVWRFWGRDQPQSTKIDYYPGRQYGAGGMTTLYWVEKKNQFGTVGYFESYDDYYRFDSYDELPAKPTYDTGVHGNAPLVVQKQTISVDKAC